MGKLKDVYWISSPLGYEKRLEVSEEWKSRKYAPAALGKIVDPHKEFRWFQKIKHWTLEIDGKCYELWAKGHKNIVQSKFSTDLCEPKTKDAKEWHEFREQHGIQPVRRKVGQTRLSHDKIEKKVQEIWKEFNHGWYGFFTQNCQNFARLLHFAVAVSYDDPKISAEEIKRWELIPDPAVYMLDTISKGSLAAKIILSAQALATAAALPAAEVAVGAGAVATTTTATTTLGGAGSTAGAQTAAATGASHGSAVATAGAAKGSAAGTAGAGKAGLAAKFSAFSHGAGGAKVGAAGTKLAALGQTKGAAIGGKVAVKGGAKVGGKVLLCAHPIGGVALIGASVYIHRKRKKDKVFTDKLKAWKSDQQLAEELSMTDIFELEEDMLIKAEDPEQDVSDEDIDEVIDENLVENLELTHITSEPNPVTDGPSCGAEAVSAGEDPKRSETIA